MAPIMRLEPSPRPIHKTKCQTSKCRKVNRNLSSKELKAPPLDKQEPSGAESVDLDSPALPHFNKDL